MKYKCKKCNKEYNNSQLVYLDTMTAEGDYDGDISMCPNCLEERLEAVYDLGDSSNLLMEKPF